MSHDNADQKLVIALETISGDQARGFVVPPRDDGAPAFVGTFDADYVCGNCSRALCTGVRRGVFRDLVFRCGGCGALNRVP